MLRWLMKHAWTEVYSCADAEGMATALVETIDKKMDELYTYKKVTVKSTDAPWMTKEIKNKIRSRKRTYKKEERSIHWHDKKRETKRLVKEAKKSYYDRFVELAKATNNSGLYY